MSTQYRDECDELLAMLHRAERLSRRVADRELIKYAGVGRAMFLILDLIDREPSGVSQQGIASALGLTKAAVSLQIRAATTNGWLTVRPCPSSHRQNMVSLTAAGRRVVEQGRRHRGLATQRASRALGANNIEAATRTLERFCGYLNEQGELA